MMMEINDHKSQIAPCRETNAFNAFTIILALIGFLFLAIKAVSLVRLVLSLFVVPSIPV